MTTLLMIFFTIFAYQKTESINDLIRMSENHTFSIKTNQKIKIGIIDAFDVNWNEKTLPHRGIEYKSQFKGSIRHGEAVINQISSILSKNQAIDFEITYCQVEQDLEISNCLEKFLQLDLFAINISMVIPELTSREKDLLTKISEKSIISVSAGNYKETKSELCTYSLKNKFCVAGVENNKIAELSSFNSAVNAVAPFEGSVYIWNGEEGRYEKFIGTSASSPQFLANSILNSFEKTRELSQLKVSKRDF